MPVFLQAGQLQWAVGTVWGQGGMAAVQMLAALFHIHSVALSRATVHRRAHKHTYVHMHSFTQSRAAEGESTLQFRCRCEFWSFKAS